MLLDFLKSKRNKPIVICTLYNKRYLDKLYEAGADYVILPHLLGGMWMSELIMGGMLNRKRSWGALRKIQAQDLEGSIESGLNSHLPS